MEQIYGKTPKPKCDFNKVASLLKSHFGMGKFAAYFQNNFYWKHLWMVASAFPNTTALVSRIIYVLYRKLNDLQHNL